MRKFRAVDFVSISVYWFGLSYLWNSIHPIVLPSLVPLMAPPNLKGSALGIMTSIGLSLAVIVQPVAGAVSDRSTSRWGRRRPFILLGTLLDLVLLLGIALAGNYWLLLAAYLLLQLSSNIAHGPYQGLIPDRVPKDRRGAASGAKQLAEILGIIVTSKVTAHFMGQGQLGAALSANWALATDLIPKQEAAGYLGITNLATAGAAVLAGLGGPVIDLFNARQEGMGYTALFVTAFLTYLVGATALLKIGERRVVI